TLVLGRLPGVERPALAAMLPNRKGGSVLVDVGANLEVRPKHLEQFAVMGSCFAKAVKGVESPRVVLLSIGEEEVKGNEHISAVRVACTFVEARVNEAIERQIRALADVPTDDAGVEAAPPDGTALEVADSEDAAPGALPGATPLPAAHPGPS